MDNQPAEYQTTAPVILAKAGIHPRYIIFFSFLTLALLAATGFLFYQNQKLSQQIAILKTAPTPMPTISPAQAPTQDPTANWQTYSDPKGKYSFKYPMDWTISKDVGILNDPTMKYILDLKAETTNLNIQDWTKTNICTKFATTNDPSGCTAYIKGPIDNSIQTTFLAHYSGTHTVFKDGSMIFDLSLAAREPNLKFDKIIDLYNQILSTFKFQ